MTLRPPGIDPTESLQDFINRADQSYDDNANLEWFERYLQTLRPKKLEQAEVTLLKLLQQWRPNDLIWCQVHVLQLLEIEPAAIAAFNTWWIQAAPATQNLPAGLSDTDNRRWKILNLVSKLSLDFAVADTAGNIRFAIELDGLSHRSGNPQQAHNDRIKDFLMRHLGIPLLRVDNQEVLDPAMHGVLGQRIRKL